MLDRASTFADQKIVALLRKDYIPIAVDAWYYSRRKDKTGDFYRKVVLQREGAHMGKTTQGFYIFDPKGDLYQGWNNRNDAKVKRFLKSGLKDLPVKKKTPTLPRQLKHDPRYQRDIPKGATVVDVFAKILKGNWPKTTSKWDKIRRSARGQDRMWILEAETKRLRKGEFPQSLQHRITRFHLVDNTRGEPPMWRANEIKDIQWKVKKQGVGWMFEGQVHLSTKTGDRSFEGRIMGFYRIKNKSLVQFDLVSKGQFLGGGRYTPGPPEGKFTMGFAMRLADKLGPAYSVPPQAARDLRGYLAP